MSNVEKLPNGIRITTINKSVDFEFGTDGHMSVIVTRTKVITTITDKGVEVEQEITREVSVLR